VGQLSLAAYEIVNISSVKTEVFGSTISLNLGAGLYFIGLAGVVGTLTAAVDVFNTWGLRKERRPFWIIWATIAVAVLAAVGAGIGGHNHASNYVHASNASDFHSGNSGSTGSGNSGSTGSGNSGSTGSIGNS
jgi:hypothetical protein